MSDAHANSTVPTRDDIDGRCSTHGIHTQSRGLVLDFFRVPPVPSSPLQVPQEDIRNIEFCQSIHVFF